MSGHDGGANRLQVDAVIAGALIGVFQLVGRSQLGQVLAGGATAWFFEFRLWALVMLSLWLFATVAVRPPGTRRCDAGGVRAWGSMIVLFITYMVITSLWAPGLTLAIGKSYDLLFVAWSCALTVAALRLYGVRATIEGFWAALFGLGMILAAFGLVALFSGKQGMRLAVLGGGPNVYGRNMGLLTLAALRNVFDNRRWVRIPAMVVAPLATLLLLLSGSRGAMLALFAGVIIYVGLRRADRRVLRSILLVGIVGLIALATQVGRFAVLAFQERFIIQLLAEKYFTNRDILLLDGITAGFQNPLGGLGLGGFALWGSKGVYPHNMFVEAFAEGGMLGLGILCIPFIKYVRRWRSGMGLGDSATVAGLILLLVSSSISGDLFDARGVFLVLLMAVASQAPGGKNTAASAVRGFVSKWR